jgi:hypothetical protein
LVSYYLILPLFSKFQNTIIFARVAGAGGWAGYGSEITKTAKYIPFLKNFCRSLSLMFFVVFGCPAKQDFRWLAAGEPAIRPLPDFL